MDSKLFVKYIQFLDEEADRYITNGGITNDQLSVFRAEINTFKRRVERSEFCSKLKKLVDKLDIDVESENGNGSLFYYIKSFFSNVVKSSLIPIYIEDNRYEEEVVCSFVMFKEELQKILVFHNNVEA